ncbi:LAGLIDADG family homing endonuclease [Streptomyces nigra]|uniref:LAGLIDADG family homing endonuclease n=1 Tax=Streptomyces nigra TaxID=1827580 RepID=UPI003641CE1F
MAECEPIADQFMDLTVPQYAYMFGFLQADGHLSGEPRRRGRLTVEIGARDIDLLREFQKLTPYNSSITERTRSTNFSAIHTSAVWCVCSLEARTKINQLGLPYGHKSRTITPPSVAFSGRDYVRGVIDADGSVGCTSQGSPFVSLTTSSTAVATYVSSYVKDITGADRTLKRNRRDDVYNILYTKEAAQQLAAHIYYQGCLSLDRKRSAAHSLGRWTRPASMKHRPPRIQWTPEMDRILLAAPTITHAAAELGYSSTPCRRRRWNLLHGVVPLPR